MSPKEFPEVNVVIAKNQSPYLPLPAYVKGDQVTICWRLTIWERVVLLVRGELWHQVLNFRDPLQPQKLSVIKPI